jgi:hypothetical protein
MANTTIQYSEVLVLTEEQTDWAFSLLEIIEDCTDGSTIHRLIRDEKEDGDEEFIAEIFAECDPEQMKLVCAAAKKDTDPFDGGSLPFPRSQDGKGIWFTDDGGGNIDLLIIIVQIILEHFKLNTTFSISWAVTCSRPRIGEFGGGWCVVSRFAVSAESTYDAMEHAAAKMRLRYKELER